MEISKRSIWVRKVFGNKGKSEFWNLYQELKAGNREKYFRYLRMSKERFDHLLFLVRPYLLKDTTRRVPICPEERL